MPKNIRITVGGIQYSVSSDDDEAYVKGIANELERRMNYLSEKNKFLSTTMVAVFAALEAYDNAKKMQLENDELRLEIKRLLEETACAKLEADRANRKLSEITGNTGENEDEEF